ncbi:MAG TPA: DUF4344 domain-containing metallopeptidase [Longimicrobium sp.]|nr:DUF4344 domain-containing metallopeptidase [Longimicrobium sp.]
MTLTRLLSAAAALACLLAAAPVHAQAPAAPSRGFVAEYAPTDDADHASIRASMQEHGFLEQVATHWNHWVRLPRRVPLRMAECPESGVEYDAVETAVNACYRTIDRFQGLSRAEGDWAHAGGAMIFMLAHAAAHAMGDVLALPQSARTEEGAHELTALLLAYSGRTRLDAVLGLHRVMELDSTWAEWGYARRHALTPERLRGLACLVYGSVPPDFVQHLAGLRQAGLVSDERAPRCRPEYVRLIERWGVRLDRHFARGPS